jgi:hypothetical protein
MRVQLTWMLNWLMTDMLTAVVLADESQSGIPEE